MIVGNLQQKNNNNCKTQTQKLEINNKYQKEKITYTNNH